MHAYVVAEQLSIRHASSSSIAVGRPIRCQDNLNSVDKRMCLASARRSIQCGASGLAIVFGWRMRCRICRVGAQRPYRQRLHTAPVISVRPSRPRGASRGLIRGAMQAVLTRHAAARFSGTGSSCSCKAASHLRAYSLGIGTSRPEGGLPRRCLASGHDPGIRP